MLNLVPLSNANDRALVGGKAANLCRASRLGAPVPPGFCLTTAALGLFLDRAGLRPAIRDGLESPVDDRTAYEALCRRVRAAPLPPELAAEVNREAGALLDGAPAGLAVRSSGVHEDAAGASFAGVYVSALGVSSPDDLWRAVRDCWCALWAPGARAYAARRGIELAPEDMAVLVQRTVPADAAGVLFTADPLTGNPWRLMLNAAVGLGAPVVEGRAPADRIVLDWASGQVLEREIASKPAALIWEKGALRERPLDPERRSAPAIDDRTTAALARWALCLDRAWDARLDVEWAAAGGELHVLQVRPLTALPPFFPHHLSPEDAQETWTPSNKAWYTPAEKGGSLVAPLFRDIWALEQWERHLPPRFFPRRRGKERDFNGYRYETPWSWQTFGYSDAQVLAWLDEHEHELAAWWVDKLAEVLDATRQAAEAQRRAQRARDLLPVLLRQRDTWADTIAAVWAAPQWMMFTCEHHLRRFLDDLGIQFDVGRLLQGLPCFSVELNRDAQRLGREIDDPAVRRIVTGAPLGEALPLLQQEHPGAPFLRRYEALCWRYGVRPPGWPERWSDWGRDPHQVLFAIRQAALGASEDVDRAIAARARDREAAKDELRGRVEARDPGRLDRLEALLSWAETWVPVMDDRRWSWTVHLRTADLLRQSGALLAAEGVLDREDQIMLLTVEDVAALAEMEDLGDGRALAERRQLEYERNRRLSPPPWLGCPPPDTPPDSESELKPASGDGRTLTGQGLAPGRVRGVARRVADLNDPAALDSLRPEHILVCRAVSDWPDWLALFMVVRGLVTVRGAQLHHATQISRECGVPYVNLPQGEVEAIPDGAPIAVDGTAGTVTLLEQR